MFDFIENTCIFTFDAASHVMLSQEKLQCTLVVSKNVK